LFIFITPHVIETPEEAEKISGQRQIDMQQMQEGVIKMYEKPEPGAPESEVQDGNPKFRFD
jgi:type II secretory pathway component GspD/PulD (secretin)